MKKIITLSFILLVSIISIQAITVKGKVVDLKKEPVDYATIILQTADSVYVNSTMTDSLGQFTFNQEKLDTPFRLLIQHILYETKEIDCKSFDLGEIIMDQSSHTLGEVTVKAYKPVVRLEDGKLSYNMQNLIEDKVISNAYSALLEIPGVREQDGNIMLAGASKLALIINGKPSTMTIDQVIELLKNMPQTRVLKAEVMYSAPPQYHIRGAAINLILDGYNSGINNFQGQVNAEYEQRTYEKVKTGVTLLYSTPKFSTDFMYSFTNGRNTSAMDLFSDHVFDGKNYDIEQSNKSRTHSQIQNARLGAEYKLSETDVLSLAYTTKINTVYNSTQKSWGTYSNSINKKVNDIPEQMHNVSLSYISHIGLSTGADYTFYRSKDNQNMFDQKQSGDNRFESTSEQEVNRLKLYADQNHSLSESLQLTYGASFAYASDFGKQTYKTLQGQDLSGNNTHSKLDEYTYQLYGGFSKTFSDKLSLSFSLAGEYYRLADFDQWTLFPTLELSYQAKQDHMLQFSLSSDKSYPSYWEMQGGVSYLNGYTQIQGNPELRPSTDYSAQLTYLFKNRYSLTLYGSYENDYFAQLPYQSSKELALIYKTTNFDYRNSFGATFALPFSINKVISSRLTLDGSYSKVKNSNFHDLSFENSKWMIYSSLDNTVNISSKPNIKANLSVMYVSPFIQGPGELEAMWMVRGAIKWTFASDKAELALNASDIFDTWNPKMKLDYANQNIKMDVYNDTRAISISFSYKFGGYKNKSNVKNVDVSRFGVQ